MARLRICLQPDGVQRGLVGEVIKRFEQRGYTLKGLKLLNVERSLAEKHYADLSSKPFFPALVDYICSGPVVAMVRQLLVVQCALHTAATPHTGMRTVAPNSSVVEGQQCADTKKQPSLTSLKADIMAAAAAAGRPLLGTSLAHHLCDK